MSEWRIHDRVLYERPGGDTFWFPATYTWTGKRPANAPEDVKIDPNAPVLCDCGSTMFYVSSPPGEYETRIRCTNCGEAEVIHDG